MKSVLLCFLFTCFLFFSFNRLSAQPNQSGSDIIRAMHKRYQNKPCKSYAFLQHNTDYVNDTAAGRSVWREFVEFPDKMRINKSIKNDEDFIIFKHDSAFSYKNNKLVKSRVDSSTLLLLIGGMYFRSIDDVLSRLEKAKYRLIVLSEQKWQDENVLVIGANEKDLVANQIWVSKKTLVVVRIIERLNSKDMMDIHFDTHQPWCGGFLETNVSFHRNGKLERMEEYHQIRLSDKFPDK